MLNGVKMSNNQKLQMQFITSVRLNELKEKQEVIKSLNRIIAVLTKECETLTAEIQNNQRDLTEQLKLEQEELNQQNQPKQTQPVNFGSADVSMPTKATPFNENE